jgi:hypothetical protein
MSKLSFMARFGSQLVDNGYPVIPIMPGSKVPGRFTQGRWLPYSGWTKHGDRATTLEEVEIWSSWPGCGIGIATGTTVALDIDVPDATIAHALSDLAIQDLGATPFLRIGQPPKRLLLYRTETPFAGRKRAPVEVLAHGQQFVAYAVHPDTGQPYSWPDENPLDVPWDALPVVTEEQVLAWLDAAYAAVPTELKPKSLAGPAAATVWRGPSDPRGTHDAVAAALAWIPNDDLDGHSWITIGNAIKAALGEEGRQLWLDWSKSSTKSGQSGTPDTAERRWATLRPHSVGAGKIYGLAIDRGWVPPPEITLNAASAERAKDAHPASAFLKRLAHSTQQPDKPLPYRVPPELLTVDGALKLFVDYATATAVSPQPFLALGAALCLIGTLAGRRYCTPTDLRSNLYAVGIADSGGGKDHARRCSKRVLLAAHLERYLGGEDLASSAGLLSSLQLHPARLFQLDEFGQFLKLVLAPRAPFHKAAIWSELTKLYTSAAEPYIGTEYADQKARPRVTIEQPCACLWGVTVPGPFWTALEGGALADGSLARFLVFLTEDDYPERNETPAGLEPPAELITALQAIAAGAVDHDYGGNLASIMEANAAIRPYTVPLTPAAETAMAAVRREATEKLRAHRGTPATALFGRQAENTAKLALLAAVSRNPARPVTEAHDVTWAALLVEHCIATMLREADRRVADTPAESRVKKVLEVIRAAGRISRSDFARKTQFLTRHEREEAVTLLLESRQIALVEVPGAKGPATGWLSAVPDLEELAEIEERACASV